MIDVADLRAWLGDPSEPGINDLLTALEVRAVDIVEQETERYFGTAGARTEYVKGDGTNVLRLRERPAAVTTLEYRAYVGDTWTAIATGDSDGWELRLPLSESAGTVLLRKAGAVWSSCYEYKATYTFGYTAGAEPGEIRQAVMDLVAFLYNERGRAGLKSETVGDHSYSTMVDVSGQRSIVTAIPGLARTLARWRGLVYA